VHGFCFPHARSAASHRTKLRNVGYAKKGAIAKTNKYFFHKGKSMSVLGPFVFDEGFLDFSIVEGGYDGDLFWSALNVKVLPFMNRFPEPRSVLILDNCPIHKQKRVVDAVHDIGALIIFLEPYDPDSMPVEFAYKCMKNWLRKEGQSLTEQGVELRVQLKMAMRAVGRSSSRHAFHAAGYF